MERKRDMWVPFKKKTNNKIKRKESSREDYARRRKIILFLFFSLYFFLKFTEIGPSEFVGPRVKVFYATRATRGYQKHGISPRIQVKIREILIFSFSQIYGVLMVRIFRTKS